MLFGDSDAMRAINRTIHQLRNNDTTSVLITGETGVGKEVVARAIHAGGPRASTPFVALNCGAIPYELAESVFFGHVRGAFTSAIADQTGYFERADGGTLFLDEVGDMPIETQVKLLRALDESVITPIGAQESKKVDIRVMAATNSDLKTKVEMGQFRSDLFFRLAGMEIEISPLRERKDDILLLAQYMLSALAVQLRVPTPELTPKACGDLRGIRLPRQRPRTEEHHRTRIDCKRKVPRSNPNTSVFCLLTEAYLPFQEQKTVYPIHHQFRLKGCSPSASRFDTLY